MRGYRTRRLLSWEGLEQRNLMHGGGGGGVVPELDAGVLTILGSHKNDSIQVSASQTVLTVRVNKQTFEFAAAEVNGIFIDGGKGNDTICVDESVLVGATIHGGDGNDRIYGGGGDDTITGDKGNDKLSGGSGNDTISGGLGNDWAWGDDGDDVVHGDDGNDHLLGGAGVDELFGDAGHDSLAGDEGDDLLYGGLGKDHLHGGSGNDQLFGDEHKDHLWGDDGDDQLFGGADHDHLWGGLGDDRLKGEAGNDHLDGGLGSNLLDGDDGRNKFKNGEIVDLDAVHSVLLVAELSDFTGSGITGVATIETADLNGMTVHRLTVRVENVPPPTGGTAVTMRVVVEEGWYGDVVIDSTTGIGVLVVDDVFIEAGYFISVGQSLTGSFVTA